ncbi:ARM repeat-containing protein, partial [Ramicandelaber brevisporus]
APEVVERKVKAQLNKLTKENFMDIAAEVLKVCDLCVNFTDGRILKQVVKILYDKAVDEQQYGDMYASLVLYLVTKVSSDIIDKEFTTKDGNPLSGGLVLRRYLVLQCQHAFESGWSVQMEQPEDKVITMEDMMSDQYYHLVRAKRRGLGLAKFIGCLFINKLIRPPVIKQCLVSLLGDLENPTEELCESAIMLLKTIGSTMEKDPEMKLELDTYMMRVKHLSELKSKLPSRVRFALMDLILLREKKQWVDKSASVPMTIADLH